MALEVAHITVSLRDVEQFRLFVWELRMLVDDMRVEANPRAERLERLVDRFTDADSAEDQP